MDIEFLKGIIKSRALEDDYVEDCFNRLVGEGFYLPRAIAEVLKLMEEHRPELAEKLIKQTQ